jgi:hypothetical protein
LDGAALDVSGPVKVSNDPVLLDSELDGLDEIIGTGSLF